MLNILTVTAAFIALAISVVSYIQTNSYNERSLRPELEFEYKAGVSEEEGDSGYFRIVNYGIGPARITSILATFGGVEIETDNKTLKNIAPIEGMIAQTLSEDSMVGVGATKYIYKIKSGKTSECKNAKRKDVLEKLRLEIHYESLYDYPDVEIHEDYVSNNKIDGFTVPALDSSGTES